MPVLDLMGEHTIIYTVLQKKPTPIGKLISQGSTAKMLDLILPFINRFPPIANSIMEGLNRGEMKSFTRDAATAAIQMGYDAAWISHLPIFMLRDSHTMHDVFGREFDVVLTKKGYLGLPMYRRGLLKSAEDWQALDKAKIHRILNGARAALQRVNKEYGERLFIFGLVTPGLFEPTWQSMGFETFVLATRKNKALLKEMIAFYEELYLKGLDIIAAAGIRGAVLPDDLAYRSGPMLNPKLLEELLGGSYRRITNRAHSLGIKILFHSCGNITTLLKWLADCGFDAVHPLEPTAGMELSKAKELVGDRLCLVGNIDVTRILVDAGKEEVEKAVHQAIADAGKGGGLIIAPAQNHEALSVERLGWMVDAVQTFSSVVDDNKSQYTDNS